MSTLVDSPPVALERLSLSGRLARLAGHARTVAAGRRPDATTRFASAVVLQLDLAIDAAELQDLEVAMLRAQAADREQSRAALQQFGRDLAAIGAMSEGQSAEWAVARMRAVLDRAARPAGAKGSL